MYEYLYDMDEAVKFVNRKGIDKNHDWSCYMSSLNNIGVKNINQLTVSDLYGILDDLESLCDNDIELVISTINNTQCATLIMKNSEYTDDDTDDE